MCLCLYIGFYVSFCLLEWFVNLFYICFLKFFKEAVLLHSQPKVKFREYFVYSLMRQKSEKKKTTIQKVLRTSILHMNNSQKLLKNCEQKNR